MFPAPHHCVTSCHNAASTPQWPPSPRPRRVLGLYYFYLFSQNSQTCCLSVESHSRRRLRSRHHDAGQTLQPPSPAASPPSGLFSPHHHHISLNALLRRASRPPHLSRVTSQHFTRPRQHYLNILQHLPPRAPAPFTPPRLSPPVTPPRLLCSPDATTTSRRPPPRAPDYPHSNNNTFAPPPACPEPPA